VVVVFSIPNFSVKVEQNTKTSLFPKELSSVIHLYKNKYILTVPLTVLTET